MARATADAKPSRVRAPSKRAGREGEPSAGRAADKTGSPDDAPAPKGRSRRGRFWLGCLVGFLAGTALSYFLLQGWLLGYSDPARRALEFEAWTDASGEELAELRAQLSASESRVALLAQAAFAALPPEVLRAPDISPGGVRASDIGQRGNRAASYYQHGRAATDPAERIYWYRRSAALGYPSGLFALGKRYASGQDVPLDVSVGFQLMRLGEMLNLARPDRDPSISSELSRYISQGLIPDVPGDLSGGYRPR